MAWQTNTQTSDRLWDFQTYLETEKEKSVFCPFYIIYTYFPFPSLSVPGIDGGALTDSSLTDSYFSTSFIGVNGFGSPVETKYPLMQVFWWTETFFLKLFGWEGRL